MGSAKAILTARYFDMCEHMYDVANTSVNYRDFIAVLTEQKNFN